MCGTTGHMESLASLKVTFLINRKYVCHKLPDIIITNEPYPSSCMGDNDSKSVVVQRLEEGNSLF